MKLTNKILIAVLLLSSLMPLSAGIMAFVDGNKFLEMFKVTPVDGMAPLLIIISVCFLSFFILQLAAAILLIRKHPGGRSLAIIGGWCIALSGLGLLIGFSKINFDGAQFGIIDTVKGGLILVLAYLSKEKGV
jgi:hypothetical protein